MRIGVTCNCFARSGGMEQYALNLIEALIRKGHTPVIFTMSADPTLPAYPHCEVHVCPMNWRWLPNELHVAYFNSWLRKEKARTEVAFTIACCLSGSAEIVVCGGNHIGFLKAMGRTPSFWDKWIINLEKREYAECKFVVAHANTMNIELQKYYGLPAEKIAVIYPPQTFKPLTASMDKAALREEFGLPKDRTLFLFPSSSHKHKGFELLKTYFEKTEYPEMLIVAGRPVKGEYKNVKYIGFCKEMQKLYQACDYTILASFYDPLGTAGLESVWNGTPSIMGNTIGCCEVLDSRSLRSFDVHSLKALSDVMEDVRKNPIRLEPPYQQYIDPVCMQTIDQHVDQLVQIGERLLKGETHPGH